MAEGATLRVRNYKEAARAFNNAEKETRRFVRAAHTAVGEIVLRNAVPRLARIDPRSAAGLKVRVRVRGIAVEQSLRKTTGFHPQFGALQMERALLPAQEAKQGEVEAAYERAIDKVADHFERGHAL